MSIADYHQLADILQYTINHSYVAVKMSGSTDIDVQMTLKPSVTSTDTSKPRIGRGIAAAAAKKCEFHSHSI